MATKWYCDICGVEMKCLESKSDNFITHTTFCHKHYSEFKAACIKWVEDARQKIKEASAQPTTAVAQKPRKHWWQL